MSPLRASLLAASRGVLLSLVAMALVGLTLLRGEGSRWFSRAACFGAVTIVLTVAHGLRRKVSPRLAAAASLSTLGWLPLIFLLLGVFSDPIVSTHWRCGTGQMGVVFFAPIALVPMLVTSSVVAALTRFPAGDGILRAAAFVAVGGVLLATGVSLTRLDRPDADTYVASMPVVRTLGPGESFALADGRVLTYAEAPSPARLESSGGAAADSCSLVGIQGASYEARVGEGPRCLPWTVRHDKQEDLWVIETPGTPFAFHGTDHESRDVMVRDVSQSISPPVGWTLGGVVGSLLGALFLVAGVALQRRRDTIDTIEATLEPDGWVKVPGMPPVALSGAVAIMPGPVLLRVSGATAASYRATGSGTVSTWRVGTLADARADLQARAVRMYAFALTSALLVAAPLLLSGLGGSR